MDFIFLSTKGLRNIPSLLPISTTTDSLSRLNSLIRLEASSVKWSTKD